MQWQDPMLSKKRNEKRQKESPNVFGVTQFSQSMSESLLFLVVTSRNVHKTPSPTDFPITGSNITAYQLAKTETWKFSLFLIFT
jgi:hypothetical protein